MKKKSSQQQQEIDKIHSKQLLSVPRSHFSIISLHNTFKHTTSNQIPPHHCTTFATSSSKHSPMPPKPGPDKPPKKRKSKTFETMLRQQRDRRKQLREQFHPALDTIKTLRDLKDNVILVGFQQGLERKETISHISAQVGALVKQAPSTVYSRWLLLTKSKESGQPTVPPPHKRGPKAKFVAKYLKSVRGFHSPTSREIMANSNAIAKKQKTSVSKSTCDRVCFRQNLTGKKPVHVLYPYSLAVMLKRKRFAIKLLKYLADRRNYFVFIDETSFEAAKEQPKRFSTAGTPAINGLANAIHSRSKALNMIIFISPDGLISSGVSYEMTNRVRFQTCFLQALIAADKVAPKQKRIRFIIDNATYHKVSAIVASIQYVVHHFHLPKWRFSVLFTSPYSPDLNLAEYFNNYIKSTMRDHMGRRYNSFLGVETYIRPRGRKPDQLSQYQSQLVDTDYRVSNPNVSNLAETLLEKCKKNASEGCWNRALGHISQWCHALIKFQGDYDKARIHVADLPKPTLMDLPWVASQPQTRSFRNTSLDSAKPPYLTDSELDLCIVHDFDLSDTSDDSDYTLNDDSEMTDTSDQEPNPPIALDPFATILRSSKRSKTTKFDIPYFANAFNSGRTPRSQRVVAIEPLDDGSDSSDTDIPPLNLHHHLMTDNDDNSNLSEEDDEEWFYLFLLLQYKQTIMIEWGAHIQSWAISICETLDANGFNFMVKINVWKHLTMGCIRKDKLKISCREKQKETNERPT